MTADLQACPLCRDRHVRAFSRAHGRQFFACDACRLVYVASGAHPTPEAESARYRTHQNDPSDAAYRAFLDRLAVPLAARLSAGAEGLDYGSGPGPTLSVMLAERGFPTWVYDPFFSDDETVLGRTYDFVTCTETAEHFFDPGREFDRLQALVRPGGWLAVMTEMRREDRPFETWHYARDPTHVSFYHPETMAWLADRYGWLLERPHPNVVLFKTPDLKPRLPA
jgi:hypothetical protein